MKSKSIVHFSKYYKSKEYKICAAITYQAMGNSCLKCSSEYKVYITPIKPLDKFPHLASDLNNFQPMCKVCQKDHTGYDWRSTENVNAIHDVLATSNHTYHNLKKMIKVKGFTWDKALPKQKKIKLKKDRWGNYTYKPHQLK